MKNNLLKMRQEKGLTQQELGDWVGVSRQSIISLESGRYNPSLELAYRLAIFFDTTIENLFIYEPDQVAKEVVEPVVSGT